MNETNITTTDQYSDSGGPDLPYAIGTGIVLFSILFMTVFGNLLVLLSVAIYRNLRHTTNYFIVNLACADLLLGLSVLPFSAMLDILGYWPFGPIVCVFWTSVDVLWCTGSIITLCVISVDRYIGITRPLRHGIIMSERRACWIISLIWVVSLAISIGPVFGWRHDRKLANAYNVCHVNREPAYVIFSVTGSFYIPMFIIVFVYSRIFKTVIEHSRNLQRGETTLTLGKSSAKKVKLRVHTGRSSSNMLLNGSSKQNMTERLIKFSRQKKAAKTLGIVVGVFILCWFPFFLVLPLGEFVYILFPETFLFINLCFKGKKDFPPFEKPEQKTRPNDKGNQYNENIYVHVKCKTAKTNKKTNNKQTKNKTNKIDIAEERKIYKLSYFQSGFNAFAILNRFIFNILCQNL